MEGLIYTLLHRTFADITPHFNPDHCHLSLLQFLRQKHHIKIMADAKTTTPPNGGAAMPTQSEMALSHSRTQNTNLTNETIDEKGNTSPGNSITDDHPQKSKRSFMTLNFWICFAISLGQIAFGYPASIIATTLGQPAFLLYMKLVKEDGSMGENANALIGATSGVFQVRFSHRYETNREVAFSDLQLL